MRQLPRDLGFPRQALALLPLASGAGAFVLLKDTQNEGFLLPIGLLGVVVTLGLFMYELRGIQRCHRLERQAITLERALHLGWNEAQFWSGPGRRLGDMLGPPAAGLVVYIAVVFSWLYVAGVGRWGHGHGVALASILLPSYGLAEVVAWFLTRRWLKVEGKQWEAGQW
jgi:hypothetical protein